MPIMGAGRKGTVAQLPFDKAWPDDPEFLKRAFNFIGQREFRGGDDNPIILGFLGWTTITSKVVHDEIPWCAAFVRAVTRRRGPALARSLLHEGVGCNFKRGCIVVFARGSSSWEGHVAFGLKEDGNNLWCLGGNQSDSVSIAPMPKSKLLGCRWL